VDGSAQRELGNQWEATTLGGRIAMNSGPADYTLLRRKGFVKNGIPLGINFSFWPSEASLATMGAAFARDPDTSFVYGTVDHLFHVPALWISAMFTEEYWTATVPKYGLKALKLPIVFRSKHYMYGQWGRPLRLVSVQSTRDLEDWKPEWESITRSFKETEYWFSKGIRPWADEEYEKWQRTPWCHTNIRVLIAQFCSTHARRDIRGVAKLIKEMLFQVDVARDIDGFDPLPADLTTSIRGSSDRASFFAVYHVLVILMDAAMPNWTAPGINGGNRDRWYFPTAQAQAAHPFESARTFQEDNSGTKLPAFFLDGEVPVAIPFVRKGRNLAQQLTIAWSVLEEYELRNIPIARAWRDSFTSCMTSLMAQVSEPGGSDKWPDFEFKIPDYDPAGVWGIKVMPGSQITDGSNARYWPLASDNDLSFTEVFIPSPILPPPARTKGAMGGTRFDRSTVAPAPRFNIAAVADWGWIVDPNEDGTIDVYDIRGRTMTIYYLRSSWLTVKIVLLKSKRFSEVDINDVTVCGDNGRQLLGSHLNSQAAAIRRALKEHVEPRGKLLHLIRPEEILEYDGKDGMPSYVVFKGKVFDVTSKSSGTMW
jgi:hypothetical protein